MIGVKFNDFHSYDDFSLILGSKEIEAPSAKTEIIDLPGADGVLDLSEYFGEVKYNNRKITFVFSTIVPKSEFLDLFSTIQNAIHGKRMNIVLDDDPDFYYVGRISVDKWKADRNIGTITVECDCEPYKYKINKTTLVAAISTSETLVCNNLRKSVIPTITVTAATQITFRGSVYSLSAGTYTSAEFTLSAGSNVLTVAGNTTITIEYREGGL